MSVESNIVYVGDLRCEATHGPSGAKISTDAPKDNHGKGEAFSPTDLVGAALGSCMVTIMGIMAKRNNLAIEGTTVHVVKEMSTDLPRRIGSLSVTIRVPNGSKLSIEDRKKLESGAHTCPVHKSLHPDIQTPIEFIWE